MVCLTRPPTSVCDIIKNISDKEYNNYKNFKKKIKSLKEGEILLLENLRFYDDEKNVNKKNNIIKSLEKIFDYYVFDAFSVSHRKQTSVVGFTKIPIISGRVVENELNGLKNIKSGY